MSELIYNVIVSVDREGEASIIKDRTSYAAQDGEPMFPDLGETLDYDFQVGAEIKPKFELKPGHVYHCELHVHYFSTFNGESTEYDCNMWLELIEQHYPYLGPKPPTLREVAYGERDIEIDLLKFYRSWCKTNKKGGGILLGSSIRDLLTDYTEFLNRTIGPKISLSLKEIKGDIAPPESAKL